MKRAKDLKVDDIIYVVRKNGVERCKVMSISWVHKVLLVIQYVRGKASIYGLYCSPETTIQRMSFCPGEIIMIDPEFLHFKRYIRLR